MGKDIISDLELVKGIPENFLVVLPTMASKSGFMFAMIHFGTTFLVPRQNGYQC